MGLFRKKAPANMAFVGSTAILSSGVEASIKGALRRLLPEIVCRQLGAESQKHPFQAWYFTEWTDKAYDIALIHDVAANGFNVFNLEGDRKRLYEDISSALEAQFGSSLSAYHPKCFSFPAGDVFSGVYVICFTQKVKDK